jgi:transcriptional antiterminator
MAHKKQHSTRRRTTPFYWIPKNFLKQYRPSWRALLAYNALAYYTDGDSGTCENLSLKTLASQVNVSKNTLIRGLAELESKGIVYKRKRSKRTSSGTSIPQPNLYELSDLSEPVDSI